MDTITKQMIKIYQLKKLKRDFMAYKFERTNELTYHHLIIPNRAGGKRTIENGAILTQNSHEYLHLIERIDPEIFYFITSEMIDENIKGRLDIENLKQIRELLLYFESQHINDRGKKGKLLIKPQYLIRPKLDTF